MLCVFDEDVERENEIRNDRKMMKDTQSLLSVHDDREENVILHAIFYKVIILRESQ